MELNSYKIWVIYKTDVKKILRCRKKIVKQLLLKISQNSRSQISMCEFKGEAAGYLYFFHKKQLTTEAEDQ